MNWYIYTVMAVLLISNKMETDDNGLRNPQVKTESIGCGELENVKQNTDTIIGVLPK